MEVVQALEGFGEAGGEAVSLGEFEEGWGSRGRVGHWCDLG